LIGRASTSRNGFYLHLLFFFLSLPMGPTDISYLYYFVSRKLQFNFNGKKT